MQFPRSQDLNALDVLLENDSMEDLEISASVLEKWLENSVQEPSDKLNFYLRLVSTMEARADIRRREARKLMERARSDEDKAQFLESLLMGFFENRELDVV
jgi:Siphovirus Gp157